MANIAAIYCRKNMALYPIHIVLIPQINNYLQREHRAGVASGGGATKCAEYASASGALGADEPRQPARAA